MERTIKNNHCKKILAFILILSVLLSSLPLSCHNHTAYAAQQNSYHDPAEHWMSAVNRTNELDANAVVTQETFTCYNCGKATQFTVWRTPEYTRSGDSNLSHNVKYSDGTMVDGVTKGNVDEGKPGVNAYYTFNHWTKAACSQCGSFNSHMDKAVEYCFDKNIYWLYDCDANFMQDLEEEVAYEYADKQYHKVTVKGGSYCAFCYGTNHTINSRLERHNLEQEVLPQLSNQRFAIVEHCRDCEYIKYDYIAAKVVVASYYGVVDGQPHTITVSDLSEAGVRASVRYGYTANSCNLTSAPNFSEEGQYTVYYEITYKYDDSTEMVESGVAYVWLRDEREPENDGCTCGCGDPNCDCQKPNCGGNCCGGNPCGDKHNFSLVESIAPSCLALGYDRYLCVNCGKIEKRDYVDSLGHAMQQIVIRDATCEVDGKILNICIRCGLAEVEYTPKGEHIYETYSVAPTCISPGYTVKECSVCGDRHITDMTEALPHNYAPHIVAATCTTGGQTTYICAGCGSSFVSDHTNALGHAWDEGVYLIEPTCADDGLIEYTCKRCGLTRREGAAGGLSGSCIDMLHGTHTIVAPTVSTKAPVLDMANTVLTQTVATVPVESVVNAAPAASAAGSVKATGHVAGAAATCTSPQVCLVCGAVMAEALGHHFWQETTQPTCTTMGYTTYNCINCNMSYKSDYVDALNHDYKEDVKAPTCTEAGYTTFTCKRCGDSYIGNYREATGHKWDKGVTVVGSTCNGAGMTEYRCLNCNESRLETQDPAGHTLGREADCVSPQLCTVCGAVLANAKGHSFEEKVVAPTCTEIGYTEAVCKDCGLSYKTEYTNALGHSYDKEVNAATCLEQGYTDYICKRCGDSHTEDYTAATGHNWNGGTLVVNATCGGEGMMEYRCLNCDVVRLDNEEAVGHTPGKEATCTEPQICTDCGAVLQQATGHNMQANVNFATCLEMGYTEYACQNEGCDWSYKTEYTKPLGHDYQTEVTNPTCLENGYTTYTCVNCGDSYVSDYREATGHIWDGGTTVTDSICNAEGMIEYRCENCNEVRLEAKSALGHTPGAKATCTEAQICTVCGAVLEKAVGHKYEKTVTAPTCVEMGYTTYICANCQDSYKADYTKAAGHTLGDWQIVKQPTTAAAGTKEQKCSKCGQVVNTEAIEKIYNQAVTDAKGEANVGKYLVTVLDTNSKNPITGATVSLYADNTMSVMLPNNRLLDFATQTTVKVQIKEADKEELKAAMAINVSVTDSNGNYAAGKTDTVGQITVPGQSNGTTNADGKVTVGYTDIKGIKQTLTIKVVKEETNRPVKDAAVSVGSNGSVSVKLPAGVDMDDNNHIGVTLTDQKKQAQSGLEVTVRSDLGNVAKGETDKDGKAVVPTIEVKPITEKHGTYIVGYEDGTFRPEAQISRAEAAAIFARLLAEAKGENISSASARYANFTDTVPGAWYASYVNYLSSYGVVMGNSKTAFRPNDDITRAELTAMAVRFFEVTEETTTTNNKGTYTVFNDVSGNHWAAEYIESAAMQGWVQGYGNGSFKADSKMTRAEAVTLINNLLNRGADEEYIANNTRKLNSFTDMYVKHWAYEAVMEAANGHTAVLENEGETWER